ncbi:calcitonin gene-related peptide type 1 receptor [Electrophorus electricus]|nr:calcitonin gene-related peptide type 1 receptor [Electrophorus electricus]XP_035377276.1 calcitonin gene-related peptide type 1 receptor [Electrophorus electricus]
MGNLRPLFLLFLPVLTSQVCPGEEMIETTVMLEEEVTEIPLYATTIRMATGQILAAQFECYLKILHDPPHTEAGPYCNRTWDGWLCWGDSSPGTAMQHCPSYFHDFDPTEKVTKVCNPDGQWFRHPDSNRLWSNYTLCSMYFEQKLKLAITMSYLAVVGHTLSVVSLVISMFIFSYFKCLSCQRISLHKNMFMSFILNSILMVIWFNIINKSTVSDSIVCKIFLSLILYTHCSNYFWMLCEGIYLHTLIIVAMFMGEQHLGWYYLLGWGFPVIPTVIHAIARLVFYDDNCWIDNTSLLYIVHGPIQVALVVNLFFLMNIVRVLITKLRVTHKTESRVYMKAVRATLILVPLMGIHFILVPLQPEGKLALAIYEFLMHIFTHFQGLLVAFVFCFNNGEVQSVVRRRSSQYKAQWRRHRRVTAESHSNYHTNSSFTETSRVTVSLEQAPFCSEDEKSQAAMHSLNRQSNGKHSYSSCKETLNVDSSVI